MLPAMSADHPATAPKPSNPKHAASMANIRSNLTSAPKRRAFTSCGMRQMSAKLGVSLRNSTPLTYTPMTYRQTQ